jgi:hypothetical protein
MLLDRGLHILLYRQTGLSLQKLHIHQRFQRLSLRTYLGAPAYLGRRTHHSAHTHRHTLCSPLRTFWQQVSGVCSWPGVASPHTSCAGSWEPAGGPCTEMTRPDANTGSITSLSSSSAGGQLQRWSRWCGCWLGLWCLGSGMHAV